MQATIHTAADSNTVFFTLDSLSLCEIDAHQLVDRLRKAGGVGRRVVIRPHQPLRVNGIGAGALLTAGCLLAREGTELCLEARETALREQMLACGLGGLVMHEGILQ